MQQGPHLPSPLYGRTVFMFFMLLLSALVPIVKAAPGDFDGDFGFSGKGSADVAGADAAYGYAVAMQPDGKIVVGGKCLVIAATSTQMCAIRVLPNGFFDTSFGSGGSKLIDVGGTGVTEIVYAVAVQPDGKIVLAGACGPETNPTEICVVRLEANGSLDSGFGLSGKSRIGFAGSGNQEARAVAVLPNGKILLGGRCAGPTLGELGVCIVRLNANGTLDTSFASSGRSIASTTLIERLKDMRVRPDGRILIATEGEEIRIPGPNTFAVYVSQLTATGSWDSTFGVSGTTIVQTGLVSRPMPRIAVQPDDQTVLAYVLNGNTPKGVRLQTGGTVDISYSYPNPAIGVSVDGHTFGLKPVLQSDGRVVFVGTSYAISSPSATVDFLLYRALDNGVLDSSYTGFGAKPILSASDVAHDAAVQVDGKLVVVGTCDAGSTFRMCVARFESTAAAARNCSMDIDGDGRVLPMTDALILARASLGLSGAAVLNGITTGGPRNTWPLIRDYLINQCGMSNLAP